MNLATGVLSCDVLIWPGAAGEGAGGKDPKGDWGAIHSRKGDRKSTVHSCKAKLLMLLDSRSLRHGIRSWLFEVTMHRKSRTAYTPVWHAETMTS